MHLQPYTKASLVADALCLGSHWIYNQGKLKRLFPDGIHSYHAPESEYHAGKQAGELTHYGAQAFWLAQCISQHKGFTQETWAKHWLKSMESFTGYLDGASKQTLATKGQSPSNSDDLAGASRIGAILDWEATLKQKIAAARAQTSLTHGDPEVADAAEFITLTCSLLEQGQESNLQAALKHAAQSNTYTKLNALSYLQQAQSALDSEKDFYAIGKEMGLTCHLKEAFPLMLYFALKAQTQKLSFLDTLSENALCAGDNSARAMLLAPLLLAWERAQAKTQAQQSIAELAKHLILPQNSHANPSANSQANSPSKPSLELKPGANLLSIDAPTGRLSAVLEWPEKELKAIALFAHCFTCGKDFLPGTRISRVLAARGIATLRIDFAGLGGSEGEFQETSFLTNLEDLLEASQWLKETLQAPKLLIGHSLGGAAVLAAAAKLEQVKAVVTIGAPADPAHVTHLFEPHIQTIQTQGEAEVDLAGRKFVIGKRFLDDLKTHEHAAQLASLRGVHSLILHSPQDTTVELENAGMIYSALKHPKSFVSLPEADHLLTKQEDARFVAKLIAVWAQRALA